MGQFLRVFLPTFDKQQQDFKRTERYMERELEKDRLEAEKEYEEIELTRIAADEVKIAADKEIEMAWIESIERQVAKDR